jgi:hypothetical protein
MRACLRCSLCIPQCWLAGPGGGPWAKERCLPLCLQFSNEVLPDFSGRTRAPAAKPPNSSCTPVHPPPPFRPPCRALAEPQCFASSNPPPRALGRSLSCHQPASPTTSRVTHYRSRHLLPLASPTTVRVTYYLSHHPLPFASPTTSRVTHYRSRHLLPLASPTTSRVTHYRSRHLLPLASPTRVTYHLSPITRGSLRLIYTCRTRCCVSRQSV